MNTPRVVTLSICTLVLSASIPGLFESAVADEAGERQLSLPVSLNEVMVALVNHSADPIWQAAWRTPASDDVWRSLERNAYQLEIAGALLTVPGTGPMDVAWTSDPNWGKFSNQLEESAAMARAAILARDLEAIKVAGDALVTVCEGCHIAFKPADPTGGKYGELSPTASDFEKEQP